VALLVSAATATQKKSMQCRIAAFYACALACFEANFAAATEIGSSNVLHSVSSTSKSTTGRELVNVLDHILDASIHDSYAIEPEEYAWSKLSGLCCYDVNRPPCNVCKYWGSPDDFCHRSKGHCSENCSPRRPPDEDGNPQRDEKGNLLPELPPLTYCEGTPPPLVDGNKVCVGQSRLSTPCYDELNSGKCTAFGMFTCQAYCWWTPGCAIFVVYSVLDSGDNMDGSCVLCYDLHESVPTPNLHTRAYRYSKAEKALPPAPPSQPSPSPPPHPPPPPPPPLPILVAQIGEDRLASCSFHAPYELVYTEDASDSAAQDGVGNVAQAAGAPPSSPSGNAMANAEVQHSSNATGCCNLCAEAESCHGFVFEEASHVCVLLPQARGQRLVPRYNAGMTAGFVRRYAGSSASPPPSPPPAQCKLVADRGFSGGGGSRIGEGKPATGTLMTSAEVCCGVCAADPECTKFSFKVHAWAPGLGDCVMFRPSAEAFVKAGEGLVAGTVTSKDIERFFLDPPLPPHVGTAPMPSPPPTPPEFPGMMATSQHSTKSARNDADDPTAIMVGAATSFVGAAIVIGLVARWAMGGGSSRRGKFAAVKPSPRGRRARPGNAIEHARLADSDDDNDDDTGSKRGRVSRNKHLRNEQLLQLMQRS
jgi:hypothetical protein